MHATNLQEVPVSLRPATESDLKFIHSSWLKSFQMSPVVKFIPESIYAPEQNRLIKHLLASSYAVVAAASDDPDHILGYVVYNEADGDPYLHWVYVKKVYRGMKIARSLLNFVFSGYDGRDIIATHSSVFFPGLRAKWPMVYNPYAIERFKK